VEVENGCLGDHSPPTIPHRRVTGIRCLSITLPAECLDDLHMVSLDGSTLQGVGTGQ
jgi:hypothetical protein